MDIIFGLTLLLFLIFFVLGMFALTKLDDNREEELTDKLEHFYKLTYRDKDGQTQIGWINPRSYDTEKIHTDLDKGRWWTGVYVYDPSTGKIDKQRLYWFRIIDIDKNLTHKSKIEVKNVS